MALIVRTPNNDTVRTGTWSVTPVWSQVNDFPDTSSSQSTMGTANSSVGFAFDATEQVPAGSTIIEVRVQYVIRKTANQQSNIGATLWNESSSTNTTDTHNPTTTTTTRMATWSTNPFTSAAWTVDQVNGVGSNRINLFGVTASDANPTIEFYSIQMEINYDPPAAADNSAMFMLF